MYGMSQSIDLIRQMREQNGHHFANDIFKCNLLSENVIIFIQIFINICCCGSSWQSVWKWVMAWRQSGCKPLPEPTIPRCLTPYGVIRPHCVTIIFLDISQLSWKIIIIGNYFREIYRISNLSWKGLAYALSLSLLFSTQYRVRYAHVIARNDCIYTVFLYFIHSWIFRKPLTI